MIQAGRRQVVVVGAGHAAGRFALHLRSQGFRGGILMVGQEPELPYERPPLSKEILLTSGRDRHAPLASENGWAQADVSFCLNVRAVSVEPRRKAVLLSDGRTITYDQLVVATGAVPRMLRISGSSSPRVFALRTLADAVELRTHLSTARRVAIVGGGVIGLEVAAAARRRGLHVDVIEAGDRVMARVVPSFVSQWIDAMHRGQGVCFHYCTSVQSIGSSVTGGLRLITRDSTGSDNELLADVIVVAIGVDPCTQWLEGSGLPVSQGMTVDAFCRSPADESCYAIGDVASTWHAGYGRCLRQETWRNAENQARAAAEILCGRAEPYLETPWMWSDQYDTNIQMLGLPDGAERYVLRGDPRANSFGWIGVRQDSVVNAALVNCSRDRRALEALISSGKRVDPKTLADRLPSPQRLSA